MAIWDCMRTGGVTIMVAAFGCGFGGDADPARVAEMTPSANAAKWGGPVESGGYQLVPLSPGSSSEGLVAFLLHPSDHFAEDGRAEHADTEGVYVLEGKVEMRLADRSIGLSAGDYLQLPGHLSHQIRKTSKRASVLVINGQD